MGMTMDAEERTQILAQAGRDVAAAVGGAGGLTALASHLALRVIAVSVFFLTCAASYELYRVHDVQSWTPVAMTVERVALERNSSPSRTSSWHLTFRDVKTGKAWITGVLAPGDFPVATLWRTGIDARAQAWRSRTGQTVTV